MALCVILIFGNLSMHSTHGHNGVFSKSIIFRVTQRFFCTNWRAIRFVYTDSTLGIEKPYAMVVWSWYWVILHDVIRLWRHGANGPQFFFTICWMWHSINEQECKVEFNRDYFKDISRFYAMRLIAIYWFTLDWKWCFVCVNGTTRNGFSTDYFE